MKVNGRGSAAAGWLLLVACVAVARAQDRPACPPAPASCSGNEAHLGESFFIVDGRGLAVNFLKGNYIQLVCKDNLNLESKSMPRFLHPVNFTKVSIERCHAPHGSYGGVLASLNVTVSDKLVLYTPPNASLASHHFADLSLQTLEIHAPFIPPLDTTDDFLIKLNNLSSLTLRNVPLPPATLKMLPRNLIALRIQSAQPLTLQEGIFTRLESLKRLIVTDTNMVDTPELSTTGTLQNLRLYAPITKLPLMNGLVNVTLELAADEYPTKILNCEKLEMLTLSHSSVKVLPEGWLTNCSHLQILNLSNLNVEKLPSRLVDGQNSLGKMTISGCSQLKELPSDLFRGMRNLRELILTNNSLTALPTGIFSWLLSLERLDLSQNQLTSASVGDPLRTLTILKWLSLSSNPLGNLCDTGPGHINVNGLSKLYDLSTLNTLLLRRTRATHLCTDWRRYMPALETLDLAYNNISSLHYEDLVFLRALNTNTTVTLSGNPVTEIVVEPNDYKHPLQHVDDKGAGSQQVTMVLETEIECNCRAYRFALVQCSRDGARLPGVARVKGLRCRGAGDFCDTDPDEMTCRLDVCAPRCTCDIRVSDNATLANCEWQTEEPGDIPRGYPLVLHSESGNLTRLPRAVNATELHLAWNHIRTFHQDDMANDLRVVDLRHNKIARVDGDSAAALFAVPNRSVWLAGNPLSCECDDRPLLDALQTHRTQVMDYEELRCSDARLVRDVSARRVCEGPPVTVPVLVAALLALGVTAAASLALLARRIACVKAFLVWLGLRPRWLGDMGDADKRYDVFVSFSHGDATFVTDTLMPWLEGGPRPYRVCVHYRDWGPGQWIPAHIATSVSESRCTLAVVSNNYVDSDWGRMEFRAAHAAALRDTSRLVAVVLDVRELPRAELDADLREYLAANTYLEWGDRWFWDKLRAALPRPPRRPLSTPPSAPISVISSDLQCKMTADA